MNQPAPVVLPFRVTVLNGVRSAGRLCALVLGLAVAALAFPAVGHAQSVQVHSRLATIASQPGRAYAFAGDRSLGATIAPNPVMADRQQSVLNTQQAVSARGNTISTAGTMLQNTNATNKTVLGNMGYDTPSNRPCPAPCKKSP